MFGSPMNMRAQYKYYSSYKTRDAAEKAVRLIKGNGNTSQLEGYRIERDLSSRYGESTYTLYIKVKGNPIFNRERRGFQAP